MNQQTKLTELIEEYQKKVRDIKELEKKYNKLKDMTEHSVCISLQEAISYDYPNDPDTKEMIEEQMATEIGRMLLKDGFITIGVEKHHEVYGTGPNVICAYVTCLKK